MIYNSNVDFNVRNKERKRLCNVNYVDKLYNNANKLALK